METLLAISSNDHVAPWIQKLRFRCCTVQGTYPFPDTASGKTEQNTATERSCMEGYLRVHAADRIWHPDAWQLDSRVVENEGVDRVVFSDDTNNLVSVLSTCLGALPNLNQSVSSKLLPTFQDDLGKLKSSVEYPMNTFPR